MELAVGLMDLDICLLEGEPTILDDASSVISKEKLEQ